MNSHQKHKNTSKVSLLYVFYKARIMICSVCRPQYFISHTKSQRSLATRHRLFCEKLIYITHSKRELGTPVVWHAKNDKWEPRYRFLAEKKIFLFGLIQKIYEKHYCYINPLSQNQRYSALYPVMIGMVVSIIFVYYMHKQSTSRLQIYFSSLCSTTCPLP